MIDVIPTNKDALKTWLVDSTGNIAVSAAGLALLEVEITPLHRAAAKEFGWPNESRAGG